MRHGLVASFMGAVLLMIIAGTGCSNQRALWQVRQDGDFHFDNQRYGQAATDYAEVADRDPADWRYRAKFGQTLLFLNQPEEAREQLAVANGLRPDNDDIAELYAEAMLAAGAEDALMRFLRDRAQRLQRVQDHMRLGRFAARAGDVDEAERALLTAARLDAGQSLDVQLALADFYAGIGDEERALRRLRMALFLAPTDPDIQRRIRAYGEIPGPSFALQPLEMQ